MAEREGDGWLLAKIIARLLAPATLLVGSRTKKIDYWATLQKTREANTLL